jgi:hypothetical protein
LHPALVPVLIFSLRLCNVLPEAQVVLGDILTVEADSGLTGVDAFINGADTPLAVKGSCDDPTLSVMAVKLSNKVVRRLSIIQQSALSVSVLKAFVGSYLMSSERECQGEVSKMQAKQNAVLDMPLDKLRFQLDVNTLRWNELRARADLQVARVQIFSCT